jgi:ribokinase
MMAKRPSAGLILVSGLINLETTLRVERFPLAYEPIRFPFFGIQTAVAGVGYNLTKALTTLGRTAQLQALIGRDWVGEVVRETAAQEGLPTEGLHSLLAATAQSVILYDETGRRMIHTDLKDAQEQSFPPELFSPALESCELAVLGNINWSRPFLAIARQLGKPIAADVHTIADLEDEYNRDFMAAADVLFMSDERLPMSPEEWARAIFNRYGAEIVAIGLGGEGALLAVRSDGFMERIPAVYTRPVVNTVGAGDALFAAFLDGYSRNGDPYAAMQRAMIFASYKIGAAGAAQGFLTAAELDDWAAGLL